MFPAKPIFFLSAPRHPSMFLRRLCASWPLLVRSRHVVLINRNNYSTLLYSAYVPGNRGCLKTHLTPTLFCSRERFLSRRGYARYSQGLC